MYRKVVTQRPQRARNSRFDSRTRRQTGRSTGGNFRIMRVVLYYPRALTGNGGMTTAVRRLAQGLASAGAEVVVVCDGGTPLASQDVRWEVLPHAGPPGLKAPIGLENVLRGSDLLVLHSAWVLHNVRAAEAAARVGVPYLLTPRGGYDPQIVDRKRLLKRLWWTMFERRLVRQAAGLHVFFDAERSHIEALGYRGALVVAPNGVEIPTEWRWQGSQGGYVLWLGRFDAQHKGLDLLLRALAVLPTGRRPVLRLHGPDHSGQKERLRRLALTLGVGDHVVIGPAIYGDEKWRLLTEASAFAYPSRWEAFGNSAAEAVGLGVPTLVTPYPLGHYLADRGGAVLASATAQDLARGLERVQSSDARAIAGKGADLIRSEFGWNDVSRSWLRQMEALV
jgi:glycosyltransferase involved in cell wall biosynthesis